MRRLLALCLALGLTTAVACGDDDDSVDTHCTPGTTRSCDICRGDTPGVETCNATTRFYDSCVCPAIKDPGVDSNGNPLCANGDGVPCTDDHPCCVGSFCQQDSNDDFTCYIPKD